MNYIILFSIIMILALLLIISILLVVRPSINRYLDIKEKDIKNKKYEIYNNIDINKVSETMDSYIDSYVNRYIVYKFMSQKTIYINKDDQNQMILDITKNIIIDISDFYLYYINLLCNIENQEDITRYIKNKVTNAVIETVASYNSSMIPAEQ